MLERKSVNTNVTIAVANNTVLYELKIAST